MNTIPYNLTYELERNPQNQNESKENKNISELCYCEGADFCNCECHLHTTYNYSTSFMYENRRQPEFNKLRRIRSYSSDKIKYQLKSIEREKKVYSTFIPYTQREKYYIPSECKETKYDNNFNLEEQKNMPRMGNTKKTNVKEQNKNSKKIINDLTNFNKELLELRRKLNANKKIIPKYSKIPNPSRIDEINNYNKNRSMSQKGNKFEEVQKHFFKDKNNYNNNFNSNYNVLANKTNHPINLKSTNFDLLFKNSSKDGFSFTILGQPSESSFTKDIIISELSKKNSELVLKINNLQRRKNEMCYQANQEKDIIIENQRKEIKKLQYSLQNCKDQIKDLVKRLSLLQSKKMKFSSANYFSKKSNVSNIKLKQHPERLKNLQKEFEVLSIEPNIKLEYNSIPSAKVKNITVLSTVTSSTCRRNVLNSSSSNKRFFSKLNLQNDLIQKEDMQIKTKKFSDNLIYKFNDFSKKIMCFDCDDKSFHILNYADYGDFDKNISSQPEGNIFLTCKGTFFIITGINYDMLYSFKHSKNTMNKLCSLRNNHRSGTLIYFQQNLICLSGVYNKKAEIYSIVKNEWGEMPEMNIERSSFSAVVLKEKYLIALFGLNSPKNQCLNTIEYLDLEKENEKWRYLNYKNENLLSLHLKGSMCLNFQDEKIIIIGGFDGKINKPLDHFIQIVFDGNFDNNPRVESVERKLKDLYKHKAYTFSSGFTEIIDEDNRVFQVTFDDLNNVHVFQMSNLGHDVYSNK